MDSFNENVFRDGHYKQWNDKFGNNFTDNNGIHNQLMVNKNIQTGGGYQAEVSGMYGEFTIAAIFKSLPEEYVVLNDILLQTGTQFRKYTAKEYNKYGLTPWELCVRTGKKNFRPVKKEVGIQAILSGKTNIYEIVKKSSQLDHVIVSPYGIFIVETKNHKGFVFGNDITSRVWTQVLNGDAGWRAYGGHSHYTFFNPVTQNELHLQHLSKELKVPRKFMTGMIVFTNPDAHLGNVNCNCCYTLDMFANALFSYNNIVWNKKQTEYMISRVEEIDSSNYTLSKEHVMYIKDMQHRHEINRMIAKGRK